MSIHPKEKARRRSINEEMMRLSRCDPAAAKRLKIQHGLLEKAYEERNRRAMSDGVTRVMSVGTYSVEYTPRTGEFHWVLHSDSKRMFQDALSTVRNGTRVIYGEGGKAYSAARIAYQAVHGEIPEDHMVYCVDKNPANLKPNNLRSCLHRAKREVIVLSDEARERVREALRAARESKTRT